MKKSKSITAVVAALFFTAVLADVAWVVSRVQNETFPLKTATNPAQAFSPSRPESVVKQGEPSIDTEAVGADGPLPGNANMPETKPVPLQRDAVSKQSLRNDLIIATSSGNPKTITATISKVTQTTEDVKLMKEFLGDQSLLLEARKHAAEALMRADTEDTVQEVVTAAIKEIQSGKPDTGGAILSSLQMPVGLEGAKGLLNVLLGQNGSANISYPLPVEVQSALRKTLRSASDTEEIGGFMARLYSNMQSTGQSANANELLNGVAYPAMLAELVAQAQVQGKTAEVSTLFDRLIASDDAGVVGAVARLASKQPSLLTDASEVLFNWSLQHPQQAQPGLFAEYLNNRALPPEQRVVAAFGLAGLVGKADVRRTLEKSISSESNENTRRYFEAALANLESEVTLPSPSIPPKK